MLTIVWFPLGVGLIGYTRASMRQPGGINVRRAISARA
jgi:hypothetical protein